MEKEQFEQFCKDLRICKDIKNINFEKYFKINIENNQLIFSNIDKELLYELYCDHFIEEYEQNENKSYSFIDILYNNANSYNLATKTYNKFYRIINSNMFDHNNINYFKDLFIFYCLEYNNYRYSKYETIDKITEAIPINVYINLVNKQIENNKKPIEVKIKKNNIIYAGKLSYLQIQKNMFGAQLLAYVTIISKDIGNDYLYGDEIFSLNYIPFIRDLKDIGLEIISEEEKEAFTERGLQYIKYTKNPSYSYYEGFAEEYHIGSNKKYYVKSRVMIDIKAMNIIESNIDGNWYKGNIFSVEDYISLKNIKKEDYWMFSPVVYGFDFASKRWLEFDVTKLKDINFSENAFDELIIPNKLKDVFLASLTCEMPSFDAIQGKGNGKIYLLSGPAGCGKTMTAESVAEYLKKPLYFVSVGELGLNPGQLEKSLEKIMDIIIRWDAIVLLDEVDVFAAKRGDISIERNAMTAIFLRQLEKFSGIMFMTTNLKDNLDEAFISRCTASIKYNALNENDRLLVWKNLLNKASTLIKIEDSIFENLSNLDKLELNGRTIKNKIRLAYSLALYNKDEYLKYKYLKQALDL